MSDWTVLLDALGLGNEPSLAHIKELAASVQPSQMEHLADQLDRGHTWGNRGSTRLDGGIDKVVTGWKGQAADAASVKVAKTSQSSQETSAASAMTADRIRTFAATVRSQQAEIKSIPTIDTSLAAAAKDAGAGAVLPAVLAGTMMKRQAAANKNRDQAAKHLDTMNGDGTDYGKGEAPFPAGKSDSGGYYDKGNGLPKTLRVDSFSQPGTSGGTGSGDTGGSGSSGGGNGSNGTGGNGGGSNGTGGNGTGGNDGGNGGGGSVATGGGGPLPGVEGTNPTSGGIPSGPTTPQPVAASAGPIESGGVNPALIGGLAAGGGALAAAGGLAGGMGRGALAGSASSLRAGSGTGDSFSRGGAGGSGNGLGSGADPDGPGAGGRGLTGRGAGALGEAAETSAMRPGLSSSAMASEAAGSRGFMPGAGAGTGARGSDDDELERRPDYLVAGDDIWGDGRLAAPPVLG